MKTNIKINYEHVWFDHPLFIKFFINDRLVHADISGQSTVNVEKLINLQDDSHDFRMEITGKNVENTKLDDQSNIVQDSYVEILDLQFNDISVVNMLKNVENFGLFVSDDSKHKITQTSTFGFNGVLNIRFKVPIYNWLLELMF